MSSSKVFILIKTKLLWFLHTFLIILLSIYLFTQTAYYARTASFLSDLFKCTKTEIEVKSTMVGPSNRCSYLKSERPTSNERPTSGAYKI